MDTQTPANATTVVKLIFWGPENYKTPCGRYMITQHKGRTWVNNVVGTRTYNDWVVWDCVAKDYIRAPHSDSTFRDCLKFLAKILGVAKVVAPRGRKEEK